MMELELDVCVVIWSDLIIYMMCCSVILIIVIFILFC